VYPLSERRKTVDNVYIVVLDSGLRKNEVIGSLERIAETKGVQVLKSIEAVVEEGLLNCDQSGVQKPKKRKK
jgi:hypothetical protein